MRVPRLIVHSELKSVHPGFPVAFIFKHKSIITNNAVSNLFALTCCYHSINNECCVVTLDRVSALHHTWTFEIVHPEKFLRIGPGLNCSWQQTIFLDLDTFLRSDLVCENEAAVNNPVCWLLIGLLLCMYTYATLCSNPILLISLIF